MKTVALLSMLHESPLAHSGARRFRGEAVLAWTLRRLARSEMLNGILVAAWDDQRGALHTVLGESDVHRAGARRHIGQLEAITAAQKWADGWRGGLLSTCAFDRGFVAEIVREIAAVTNADAIVLIDPASALVDPKIIDQLIETAAAGHRDFYFTQAPPGLGGLLLKRTMIDRLANGKTHPGRVVHYLPDAPVLDPVTSDACVALPLGVTRSVDRFLLDSDHQIDRISTATESLNGSLIVTEGERLAEQVGRVNRVGRFPREIVLELNTRRLTKPVFNPVTHLNIDRPEMPLSAVNRLIDQIAQHDNVRITLAGVGDPLLHSELPAVLEVVKRAHAISIETDLLEVSEPSIAALIRGNIDVISVHVPAMAPATYAAMMGVDRLVEVVDNIKRLLSARQQLGRSTPIIVPTFVKTQANLDEMEQWYDTWLGALGSAVITGPRTFVGRIPDCAAADMSPPVRKACQRIDSRLTILGNGAVVACEQDILGEYPLGNIMTDEVEEIWTSRMQPLRAAHANQRSLPVVCTQCKDWYRP